MSPTPEVVDLICGVLARAARLYPVEIHAFCFLSNHFHLLMTVSGADRLAMFMNYLNSNLAREVGREVGWRERFWGRRYQAILVSSEEAAQVGRMLYILRHGCKENLVRRPGEWPGPTSTEALLTGKRVRGTWFDRSREYELSRRNKGARPAETAREEVLELIVLPCWRKLPLALYRARCSELVALVEAETDRRISATGTKPIGRDRILRQNPHSQPRGRKKGPAPLAHAVSSAVRRGMRRRYVAFATAFRRAATCLRLGLVSAPEALRLFPPGSFPPLTRYVPSECPAPS